MLAVANEKGKVAVAQWLTDHGAKEVDPDRPVVAPKSMTMETQWNDEDAMGVETLADRVLAEIWDSKRLIALLKDMEERFAPLVAQAEYIIAQTTDTEAELRQKLAEARYNAERAVEQLAAVKSTARDEKIRLTDAVKKTNRDSALKLEKKQFLEWQLRGEIADTTKKGVFALEDQRKTMVDDAQTKMTELVLDRLMEDPARNPTLMGELQSRRMAKGAKKRANRRRGSAGSGMAAALGLSTGLSASMDASASASLMALQPPRGSTLYQNAVGMDPATTPASALGASMSADASYSRRPGSRGRGLNEGEQNVDGLIESLEDMRGRSQSQQGMEGSSYANARGFDASQTSSVLPPVY